MNPSPDSENSITSHGSRESDGGRTRGRDDSVERKEAPYESLQDRWNAEFEQRFMEWRKWYDIRHALDEWAYRMVVRESLEVERIREAISSFGEVIARMAHDMWESEQRLVSIELAEKLPKKPEIISAQLKCTKHGCLLFIERWHALLRIVKSRGDWSEEQKAMALDMLGISLNRRQGRRLLNLGVPDRARKLAKKREALALREIRGLEKSIETKLNFTDQMDKEFARSGLFRQDPQRLGSLRRQEKERMRYRNQYHKQLRKVNSGPPELRRVKKTGKPLNELLEPLFPEQREFHRTAGQRSERVFREASPPDLISAEIELKVRRILRRESDLAINS